MPTVHIESKKGEISDIVLMPGDPKRSEYIAKKLHNGEDKILKFI